MRTKEMKSSHRSLLRFLSLVVAFAGVSALPLLSGAHPASSVNVVNNSSGDIRHIYLSHVNADDWGSDQLNNATLHSGQSATISNFACDAAQIKVIGENQDGCFVSTVIACGTNATWTITNDTAADCGQ
jgi:hypothetical protein